jgi:hypothetical protein
MTASAPLVSVLLVSCTTESAVDTLWAHSARSFFALNGQSIPLWVGDKGAALHAAPVSNR